MTDAYIFDLDDTLMPTNTIFAQPRNRMLLATLAPHGGPDREAHVQQVYQSIVPHDPYLAYLLAQLAGPKYMFTNGTRMHARCAMNALGIATAFEGQLDRDGTNGELKPSPRVFATMARSVQQCCRDCGRVVFLDDQLNNLQQGKRFGWHTVWVHPHARARPMPPGVDVGFDSIYSALIYLTQRQKYVL
jgi:HAD superfamily hydrolase (TIGR01509 family)